MNADFPEKLQFLFQPARYKVARGGRGSAKSWSFARALLILGAQSRLRILCAREIQKSIKDSVHKLLADQIQALGLGGFYQVLETEIRGKNGTEFSFVGLAQHTVESIKSFEGCDKCWIEEGQFISKKSWEILIPTIRKDGSEIWVSFNPELESDETYQRFVVSPPPDCVSVKINYIDNPWFPEVLEAERLHCQTANPKDYPNIWEGECKPAVEGAIYYDQMAQAAPRICNLPHDPLLKTHAVWDLGYNDAMSIILAQVLGSEIRIISYIEGNQRTLADYSAELKALLLDGQPINWGAFYLPHDGFAKRHQTGKTDSDVLMSLGWSVSPTPNIAVEAGINRARDVFNRIYFNKDRTARLTECLKRYRRQFNQQTQNFGAPLHDEYSHGADAFRYLALCADQLTNDTWGGGSLNYPRLNNA